MNAHDLRVEEQVAPYLVAPVLTDYLDTFASAPEGFKRLRELVLNLAVRGRLVPQTGADRPIDIGSQTLPLSDVPFRIPQSWRWARIGEVLSLTNGRAFKPAEWLPFGLPIVRIQNLNNLAAAFNHCDETSVDARHIINDKEFLISWSGTPGTSFGAFIWTRGRAALNQHIFKCDLLTKEIDQVYLRLAINGRLDEMIAKAHGGVGLQHITKGKLERLALPLPPLAEQSRIVAKVEELMALVDRLEAKVSHGETVRGKLLDALLTSLADSPDAAGTADAWTQLAPHFDLLFQTPADVDRLQQTLLTLAVKGRLVPQDPNDEPAAELLKRIRAEKERLLAAGKIRREKPLLAIDTINESFSLPPGWAWARIAALAEIGTGTTPSRNEPEFFTPPEVPWVTSGETSQSEIFDTREKVSLRALQETSLKLYPAHSLLVALYGQGKTRGQVSELMVAAATNQACAVIVLHGVAFECKSYVKLYFKRIYEQLRELSAGGAQPNLTVGKVADMPIPLPPLAEQSRIVAEVASLTALCDRLRERLAARRDLSAKLATALTETALQ